MAVYDWDAIRQRILGSAEKIGKRYADCAGGRSGRGTEVIMRNRRTMNEKLEKIAESVHNAWWNEKLSRASRIIRI